MARYLLVLTFADSERDEVTAGGRIVRLLPGVTAVHLVDGEDVPPIDALRRQSTGEE
jgi:hypothetical protein